jgi:hypothetical protein
LNQSSSLFRAIRIIGAVVWANTFNENKNQHLGRKRKKKIYLPSTVSHDMRNVVLLNGS